eukprot:gene1976-3014_t
MPKDVAAGVNGVLSGGRETRTGRNLVLTLFLIAERGRKECYQLPWDIVNLLHSFIYRRTVSVELHIGVVRRERPSAYRGRIVLPHATRQTRRMAMFCFNDADQALARAAGADAVDPFQWSADRLSRKNMRSRVRRFDAYFVADTDVRKIPRLLGPTLQRVGVFPSVVSGASEAERLASLRRRMDEVMRTAGRSARTRDWRHGVLSFVVGHTGLRPAKLEENVKALFEAIPEAGVRGSWITQVSLKAGFNPSFSLYDVHREVRGIRPIQDKRSARQAAATAFAEGLLAAVLASDVPRLCKDHDLVPSQDPWTGRAPRSPVAREYMRSLARRRREALLTDVLARRYEDPHRPGAGRKTPFQFALRYSTPATVAWLVSRYVNAHVDDSTLTATVLSKRSVPEKVDLLRCFLASTRTVKTALYNSVFSQASSAAVTQLLSALGEEGQRKLRGFHVGKIPRPALEAIYAAELEGHIPCLFKWDAPNEGCRRRYALYRPAGVALACLALFRRLGASWGPFAMARVFEFLPIAAGDRSLIRKACGHAREACAAGKAEDQPGRSRRRHTHGERGGQAAPATRRSSLSCGRGVPPAVPRCAAARHAKEKRGLIASSAQQDPVEDFAALYETRKEGKYDTRQMARRARLSRFPALTVSRSHRRSVHETPLPPRSKQTMVPQGTPYGSVSFAALLRSRAEARTCT